MRETHQMSWCTQQDVIKWLGIVVGLLTKFYSGKTRMGHGCGSDMNHGTQCILSANRQWASHVNGHIPMHVKLPMNSCKSTNYRYIAKKPLPVGILWVASLK